MQNTFSYIAVNQNILKATTFQIPLSDQAFLYGYGLFETLIIQNSKPILLDTHLQRMKKSAAYLKIPSPLPNAKIKELIQTLIFQNQAQKCILNIYLSAGEKAPKNTPAEPQLIIILRPLPPNLLEPQNIAFRQINFNRSALNAHKTMAYLPNLLEQKRYPEFSDIVLYNQKKEILETPIANVFFIKDQKIHTPKSRFILPGITRQFLVQNQKKLGFPIIEREIFLSELPTFQEIFLTNSLRGIIQIKSTENYPNLTSKKQTQAIATKYQTLLRGEAP